LGLNSDRQIWAWRTKNPAIDETVALLQAAPLFEHRADIFKALITSAASGDYKSHQDRKLAFEMMGDYVQRMKVESDRRNLDDLSEMSEEELQQIARLGTTERNEPDEQDDPIGRDDQGDQHDD
jgi:hypothetical protein